MRAVPLFERGEASWFVRPATSPRAHHRRALGQYGGSADLKNTPGRARTSLQRDIRLDDGIERDRRTRWKAKWPEKRSRIPQKDGDQKMAWYVPRLIQKTLADFN
jgi:hypothetical protein